MKIKAKKRDLENAIQIATICIAGGDEEGEVKSHYVFRFKDNKVDVLSYNGARLFAGALLSGATVEDAEDGAMFTVPGWRVRSWLGAITDGDEDVSLSFSDGTVKATAKRGSGKLSSLNPKDFPFWDNTIAEAKAITKVSTEKLTRILSYERNFVADNEQRSPALVATEAREGTFNATDSVAVSMITSPAFANSTMRIHGKDIGAVLSFLALKGSDEVEVLEHDRCLFLRRVDGSVFGVSKWMHEYPALKINRNEADKCWFSLNTSEMMKAIKYLTAFAKKDDDRLRFRFDPSGKIALSMDSGSGDAGEDEQMIPCVDHGNMDILKAEGYDGFALSRNYVEILAGSVEGDNIRFGVNWAKRNGYVTVRQERDGDEYFTLVVWIRKQVVLAALPASQVSSLRSRLDRVIGRRDGLRQRLVEVEAEVKRLESEEELADLAAGLIRTLIDSEVTEGVKAVEELLSEGLQAVFDDQDLSVRADVDVQRGKVSVDFITIQRQADGTVTEGLSREAFGGAVTTVQSVLLRVIVTIRRGLRPVLFLDETLPAFDSNYVHNMGKFLHVLCDRLGVDILLVTHNPAMVEAADHAYRIQKVNGAATFKRIR